jgi:hypothetical protein
MIEKYYERYYLQECKEVDDGFGGAVLEWVDGAEIQGLYKQSVSSEVTVAEAKSVFSHGFFVTGVDTFIGVGDVIRRERDGVYIKIVGMAVYAPAQAGVQVKKMAVDLSALPPPAGGQVRQAGQAGRKGVIGS